MADDELFSSRRPSPRPRANVVSRLEHREIFGCNWNQQRKFFTSIVPNLTIVNVEKPLSFVRKFSPDGRLLIAFSGQQNAVEIYTFRGVEMAGKLLQILARPRTPVKLLKNPKESPAKDGPDFNYVRQHIFQTLFRLKYTVSLSSPGPEQLNRECSLFTPDSRHLIVAAAAATGREDDQGGVEISTLYQNRESLRPISSMSPEDIRIFSVDLEHGILCDSRLFKCDKIFLSHNQGLYLLDRLLVVLSVQHQTLYSFQIDARTGHFIPLQAMGKFLYDDDELFTRPFLPGDPGTEIVHSGLKHRLLAFLYRKAREGGASATLRYYQQLPVYERLKMLKMQLIDEERVLVRAVPEELITYSHFWIFFLYNMRTTEMEGVFESTSPKLLKAYEVAADQFRHPGGELRFPCSISSNREANENYQRYKRTILQARGGGRVEVVRRVLRDLPICAQSFSASPYLDLSLFSYDEKLVSMLERPRACGDSPVRFFARNMQQLRFKMLSGLPPNESGTQPQQRRLVAYVFHPDQPFAISVQRHNRDYILNFHLRFVPG